MAALVVFIGQATVGGRSCQEGRAIIIHPFRACRYNDAVVGDPGACASPPYDQFSPEVITRLEGGSPHNVCRIVKAGQGGREHVDRTGARYERAASLFADWLKTGAVTRDPADGVYPYSQTYLIDGVEYTRRGFIALADLGPANDGQIFGHEKTIAPIREDRALLRTATQADFGLVFLLYNDPSLSLDRLLEATARTEPALTVTSPFDGSVHRLWCVDAEGQVDGYVNHMLHLKTVIADGHHRFAAAQESFQETGNPAAGRVMAAFFNTQAAGMAIFPIHRLARRDVRLSDVVEKIGETFTVLPIAIEDLSAAEIVHCLEQEMAQSRAAGGTAFGMVGNSREAAFVFEARQPISDNLPWPSGTGASWRSLETAIFETAILKEALGFTADQIDRKDGLDFRKDAVAALEAVRGGEAALGFLMPPTDLDGILRTAFAGEMLPQKSTFFYPKLLTGLTIHHFGGEVDPAA